MNEAKAKAQEVVDNQHRNMEEKFNEKISKLQSDIKTLKEQHIGLQGNFDYLVKMVWAISSELERYGIFKNNRGHNKGETK